jgi:hypothetical protein
MSIIIFIVHMNPFVVSVFFFFFFLWTPLVTPSQCPKHLVMLVRLSFSMSLTCMEPSCIFCCFPCGACCLFFGELQKSYSVLHIMPTPFIFIFILLAFPISLVSPVYVLLSCLMPDF